VKFARAGLAFPEIPQQYRPGVILPGGVPDGRTILHPGVVLITKTMVEWDVFHLMILHDETSRVQTGVMSGLAGASTIGAPPIVNYGSPEQKQKWLPGIFTGETRFCLGATEPTGMDGSDERNVELTPAGGSDLANLRTTANKSPDGRFYIVNGHKVSS